MPQNTPKSPALIPTPDEVALLTSLGFRDVNHSKKPEWPDFVWLSRQNAAFLTISITAHIIGEPMWRKYRLVLYLHVYCDHESELLTQKTVKVKVSSIADALRFLGLNHETAANQYPGAC